MASNFSSSVLMWSDVSDYVWLGWGYLHGQQHLFKISGGLRLRLFLFLNFINNIMTKFKFPLPQHKLIHHKETFLAKFGVYSELVYTKFINSQLAKYILMMPKASH